MWLSVKSIVDILIEQNLNGAFQVRTIYTAQELKVRNVDDMDVAMVVHCPIEPSGGSSDVL